MRQIIPFIRPHQFSRVAIGSMVMFLSLGSSGLAEAAISLTQPLSNDALASPTSFLYAQVDTDSDSPDEGDTSDVDTETPTTTGDRSEPRFSCEYDDGNFVVMYNPESRPDEQYAWAIPGTMGGGWSAERRCDTISERLESYRPDGLLELQTGEENGYNIVCATTNASPGCRIVFTVPNDQDPIETRDRVFENLAVANSGQQTTGVQTFREDRSIDSIFDQIGSDLGLDLSQLSRQRQSSPLLRDNSGLDLRPFLDPADGGTGSQL